jgi:hypothetical protein
MRYRNFGLLAAGLAAVLLMAPSPVKAAESASAEIDKRAWVAARAVGEAVTRSGKTAVPDIRAYHRRAARLRRQPSLGATDLRLQ